MEQQGQQQLPPAPPTAEEELIKQLEEQLVGTQAQLYRLQNQETGLQSALNALYANRQQNAAIAQQAAAQAEAEKQAAGNEAAPADAQSASPSAKPEVIRTGNPSASQSPKDADAAGSKAGSNVREISPGQKQ